MKTAQEFRKDEPVSPAMEIADREPERRKKQRVCPTVLSGILETKHNRQVVTIEDLSLTGARILNAPPALELGETMRLAIMIEGRAADPFPCTVVHKKGNEAHLEVGVRFEPVDPDQSRGLDWYMRELMEAPIERAETAQAA